MAVARHSYSTTGVKGNILHRHVALMAPVRPGVLRGRRPVGGSGRLRGFIGGLTGPAHTLYRLGGILVAIQGLAFFRGPFQVLLRLGRNGDASRFFVRCKLSTSLSAAAPVERWSPSWKDAANSKRRGRD